MNPSLMSASRLLGVVGLLCAALSCAADNTPSRGGTTITDPGLAHEMGDTRVCSCCRPAPANLRAKGVWVAELGRPTDLLSWSPLPGARAYNLYQDDALLAAGVRETSWMVPPKKWLKGREYCVKAVFADGHEGRPSHPVGARGATNPRRLSDGETVPPGALYDLTAEGEWNLGRPRILLTWKEKGKVEFVCIYRNGVKIAENVAGFYYFDEEVMPGGRYTYAVTGAVCRGEEVLEGPPSQVVGTAPAAAPAMMGRSVQITSILPNDDSAVVTFQPVPGARDYRVFKTSEPGFYKYSGGGLAIEVNGINPATGVDVVIEAVDKLGPFMEMGRSINGHGDPSNMPLVIARSEVFHIDCQRRALSGEQVFFDDFSEVTEFVKVKPDPVIVNFLGDGRQYQQFTNGRWTAGVFKADARKTMLFIANRHFMDVIADAGRVANASCVLRPHATADIRGERVLHITMEVDAHFSARRWVNITLTPAGEALLRPATESAGSGMFPPTASGKALVVRIGKAGCAVKTWFDGQIWRSASGSRKLLNGTVADIDRRHRFDVYLSATHVRVVEEGTVLVDEDFPPGKRLPFEQIQVHFVHQLYHTSNDRLDLISFTPKETYWINHRPWSDERHWDNMGFAVLPSMPR